MKSEEEIKEEISELQEKLDSISPDSKYYGDHYNLITNKINTLKWTLN